MFQRIFSTRAFQLPSAKVCVQILLFSLLLHLAVQPDWEANGHLTFCVYWFVLFADKLHKFHRPLDSNEKRARLH